MTQTQTQTQTQTERVASLLSSHCFPEAKELAEQVVATYEDLRKDFGKHEAAEVALNPVGEAWDPDVYETDEEADDRLAELFDAVSLVLVFDR